jgi:hypothetical protein
LTQFCLHKVPVPADVAGAVDQDERGHLDSFAAPILMPIVVHCISARRLSWSSDRLFES